MEKRRLETYTLEEFLAMEPSKPHEEIHGITQIAIVPLGEEFVDSPDYSMMKYIFGDQDGVLGCSYGSSDVLMLLAERDTLDHGWSIDLLTKSGCVRIHSFGTATYDGFPSLGVILRKDSGRYAWG